MFEQSNIDPFAAVARCNIGRLAVADRHEQLTYERCLALNERLTEQLRAIAPKSGAIGVLLPNRAYCPVAILACIAAGRLLVALDLRYSPDRNSLLIRDVRLDTVIVVGNPVAAGMDLSPGLPQIELGRITLEADNGAATKVELSLAEPDAAAIIIYTSGSQSRPKGVVNSQHSALQCEQHNISATRINEADHFCPPSSPRIISGIHEQMTSLLAGATLHVVDPSQAGIREIRGVIRQAGVTMVYMVPSLPRTIVQAGEGVDDFASLHVLKINGDLVFWSDIALARQTLPVAGLVQISFSSTETSGLQWFVPPDYPAEGPVVPIGYRLLGVTPEAVDEHGQVALPGELGESLVREQSVALGYRLDGQVMPRPSQLTRENSGERSYVTGDLVRERPDGLFETGGRKDRQIKVRGQRVEFGAALRASPDMLNAVVTTDMRPDGTVLVAFVVLRAYASGDALETIKARVAHALPGAMRPAAFHVVEAIPCLPSAKPDMAALGELHRRFGARAADATGEELPDPAAEAGVVQIVCYAWRNVLGRRALAGDPTYIDAGSDSLKLLQFIFVAERILHRTLPVELFSPEMRAGEFATVIARAAPENDGDEPGDTQPYVFLMPGVDGDEPILSVFRRRLAVELSFTVINYPALDDVADGFDFERVVASSCDQMLAGASARPLRLVGYSFGGLVCYAVTRRLRAAGRKIVFIGITDARLRQGEDDRATLSHVAQPRRWLLASASTLLNHARARARRHALLRGCQAARPALRTAGAALDRTTTKLAVTQPHLVPAAPPPPTHHAADQCGAAVAASPRARHPAASRSRIPLRGASGHGRRRSGLEPGVRACYRLALPRDHHLMFEHPNHDQFTRALATAVTSESPPHGAGEPAVPALAGTIEIIAATP